MSRDIEGEGQISVVNNRFGSNSFTVKGKGVVSENVVNLSNRVESNIEIKVLSKES